ncbi:hypothetical protein Pint_22724 [Pistacia integerrima]|uniref:Uncharacterized protein n=1 Tax=Pistacia integerrima TaxID=434235 RepID=A0ACC0YLT1_9ROSI|nr:hypothetical protein Pint_22724 [Pistacia integerrima]
MVISIDTDDQLSTTTEGHVQQHSWCCQDWNLSINVSLMVLLEVDATFECKWLMNIFPLSALKRANDNDNVAVDDAVSDGGECNSGGKGFGSLSCSICLDLITDNGDRSWAKLQCGHQFHFVSLLEIFASLFSMDGDFASMVVKLRKNAYTVTHLSNSNIEEELKAKMPSLDKKYTMEPEEGGAGMSLRVEGCSSEFKLLKEAMAKMESNMHELSLKKQKDDVVVIHTNETAVVVVSFWLLGWWSRFGCWEPH